MNVFTWIVIVILIVFGVGFIVPASENGETMVEVPPPSTVEMVEINGNPGVILEAESYRADAEGWSPSIGDLQDAEDAVLAAPAGDREPVIDGYRQYAGIVEDGERKIIVSSMCQEMAGWDKEWILIMDGGPCFWEATYNVDTGEMEMLIVNGEA